MAVAVRSVREARSRIEKAIAGVRLESAGSEPLPKMGPVALYGAGRMGTRVERMLAERGVPIRCFLDRGRQHIDADNGVPVYHPESSPLGRPERADLNVIVTVFNPDADPGAIEESLLRAGYGRVTGFLEFYHRHGRALGDHYWLTASEFYQRHTDDILHTLELWADATSRELFVALLEYRLGSGKARLPPPSLDDQYFPRDLPSDPRPLDLVDCGAYLGDTIEAARRHRPTISSVCAFEPDPENFRQLAASARAMGAALDCPIHLWPCGVGRTSGMVPFTGSEGGASRFDALGTLLVPCVALDDVLPTYRATLLKMDIEGAEPGALLGARELIARARPGLAISGYHRPEHLWTLPSLMHEIAPACDLYLRMHRFNGFDVVVYALPRAAGGRPKRPTGPDR
jgi:FkbM family methyltransferase